MRAWRARVRFSVPRVRIPTPPPIAFPPHCALTNGRNAIGRAIEIRKSRNGVAANRDCGPISILDFRVTFTRKGDRVVEGDGLENRCTVYRTVGSNPTPSASRVSAIGYASMDGRSAAGRAIEIRESRNGVTAESRLRSIFDFRLSILGDAENGEVAEWSKAVVLKTTVRVTAPGVRIPASPPIAFPPRSDSIDGRNAIGRAIENRDSKDSL